MPGSQADRKAQKALIATAETRQAQRQPDLTAEQLMEASLAPAPESEPSSLPFDCHPSHGLTTAQWVLMQLTLAALGSGGSVEYAVRETDYQMHRLQSIANSILGFEGSTE